MRQQHPVAHRRATGHGSKPIAFALGYDSYCVDGDTKSLQLRFESPPIARAEFRAHLAKARTRPRLAAIDATRAADPSWGRLARHADRMQLEWNGAKVRRAWFTAHETPEPGSEPRASELLAVALAHPMFDGIEEIGIGLEQWQDSHRAMLDPVLDVLATHRPRLSALALGDHANDSGHITKLDRAGRIGELYPGLERLRVTCTKLPSLRDAALPALRTLWLCGTIRDGDAFAALDRSWPALESLGVGWRHGGGPCEELDAWSWLVSGDRTPALEHLAITGSAIADALVAALAASKLLPRLRTLELRNVTEGDRLAKALRATAAAFTHLETLWLPATIKRAELEDAGVRVAYRTQPGRHGSSMK